MSAEPFQKMEALGVNRNTLQKLSNNLWPQYRSLEKVINFSAATNANGDFNGTGNPSTLLTVTGVVEIAVIAVCTTPLGSTSGTIEVGASATSAGIIAQTTASGIAQGEIWHDATSDAHVEASTVILRKIVTSDVIITVATDDIYSGGIKFITVWNPISTDGLVELA